MSLEVKICPWICDPKPISCRRTRLKRERACRVWFWIRLSPYTLAAGKISQESKNVNAPDKKPTEKPLRENPDPGDNVTEGDPEKEAAVKVGGEIPKPAPFSPANTQKGHHEVVQN